MAYRSVPKMDLHRVDRVEVTHRRFTGTHTGTPGVFWISTYRLYSDGELALEFERFSNGAPARVEETFIDVTEED